MTEQEWFHEPDPQGLLEYIGLRLSARKVRLFAVACCQTMVSFMNSPQKLALHIAEDHADGLASDDDTTTVNGTTYFYVISAVNSARPSKN